MDKDAPGCPSHPTPSVGLQSDRQEEAVWGRVGVGTGLENSDKTELNLYDRMYLELMNLFFLY